MGVGKKKKKDNWTVTLYKNKGVKEKDFYDFNFY